MLKPHDKSIHLLVEHEQASLTYAAKSVAKILENRRRLENFFKMKIFIVKIFLIYGI